MRGWMQVLRAGGCGVTWVCIPFDNAFLSNVEQPPNYHSSQYDLKTGAVLSHAHGLVRGTVKLYGDAKHG